LIVVSYDPETILVPSGENATDVIPALCASVSSLNSPNASARQASKRQFWPRRGDFEGSGAPDSQTLIVLSPDPDTILVPSGENATDMITPLCAFVSSLNSSKLSVRQASRRQFWPSRRDFEGCGAPESQILIVPSSHPDTILVPSGENATDMTMLLFASVSSLNSSKLSVRQASSRQFWPRRGDFEGSRRTRIPDFDHLVIRSGDNLGPIRGERHRLDGVAVRVRLLAQQLQCACQTSQQQGSIWDKEGRF
jgi:hypothetical protein